MASILHLVVVIEILWLISGAVSQHNQSTSKDRRVDNKQTDVEDGDFYFEKQKIQADNVVIGRPIHQTAWSEEDKEQEKPQPVDEGKDRPQSDREWSLVNLLKYVLSLVYEFVDEDTFPNKEVPPDINNTEFKNTKLASEPLKENDNRNKKNNINEKSNDISKNREDDRSQQLKSNYLTNLHSSEDIKWVDNEMSEEYDEYSSDSEDEEDIFSNDRTFYEYEDSNSEADEEAFHETGTDSDGNKVNVNKKNSADDTKRNRNKVDCNKSKEKGRHSLVLEKHQTAVNPNSKSQGAVDDVSKLNDTKPDANDGDLDHPRKKGTANEQHNATRTPSQDDRSIEKDSQANSYENCEEELTEMPVNNVIRENRTVILNETQSSETSKKPSGSSADYTKTTSPTTPKKTSKSTYGSELDNGYGTQAETPLMPDINTQNLEEGTTNDKNMKSETQPITQKSTSRQTKIVSTSTPSYSDDGGVTDITPQGTSKQEKTSYLHFESPSKTTGTSSNSIFTHVTALTDSHFQGGPTETTDLPLNTVHAYTTEVYDKNSPRSYSDIKGKVKSSQISNSYASTPLVSEFVRRSDILNQVPYTFNTKNEEINEKEEDGLKNPTENNRDSATPENSEDENSKPQHTGRSPEFRKSSDDEHSKSQHTDSSPESRKSSEDEYAKPQDTDSSPESRKPSKEEHSKPQDTGSSIENRKPSEDEHSKPQHTDSTPGNRKPSEEEHTKSQDTDSSLENRKPSENEHSKTQHTDSSPENRKPLEDEHSEPQYIDSSPENKKPSENEHSKHQHTGSSLEKRKPLEDEHSKPQDTGSSSELSISSEDDNYIASSEETEVENDNSTQSESSYSDLEISNREFQNQNYEGKHYKSDETLSGKDLSDIDGQEEKIQDEDIIRRQTEGTNSANEQKDQNMTTILMTSSPQLLQRTDVETDEQSQEQFGTILEYLYKHSNSPFILSMKEEANQFSDNE